MVITRTSWLSWIWKTSLHLQTSRGWPKKISKKYSTELLKEVTNFRKALSPGVKLAVTLRYLDTEHGCKTLSYGFRVAQNTIVFVPEVWQVIVDEISQPLQLTMYEFRKHFERISYSSYSFAWTSYESIRGCSERPFRTNKTCPNHERPRAHIVHISNLYRVHIESLRITKNFRSDSFEIIRKPCSVSAR